MKAQDDILIAYGGEIKALGDGRVGGFLVRFTDASMPDLENDFFTKETDFDADDGDKMTVYYAHGQDPKLGGRKLAKGVITLKDIGVWIEAQLKMRDEYEEAIYQMAKDGKLGWSSGTLSHLVKRVPVDGAQYIKSWPLGKDASLTPTPAAGPELTQVVTFKSWQESNPNLKALISEGSGNDPVDSATATGNDDAGGELEIENKPIKEQKTMTEKEKVEAVEQPEPEVIDVAAIAREAAGEALKAYQAEQAAADRKAVNDPGHSVNVAKHGDVWKYDNYSAADIATALEVVSRAHDDRRQRNPEMVKALALRLESEEANDEAEKTGPTGTAIKGAGPLKVARSYMKSAGIKANETDFSTNAGYGDEWIGVAYSGQLWESVRNAAQVASRVPTFEFPAGAESMVIPLEANDPIWYLVAQAGDPSSATAQITNTVPAKALGTGNKSMTLGKLGSSTIYTGEMVEDSVLPFAAQLRAQIGVSGGEVLDHVCIDGDTATGATTNINDIAGTPAGTEAFLVANGFRKSALVTTTANSRDGGALTTADFLETVKLMGAAGKVAFDKRMTSFIIDPMTHWKALELVDVKTRDVFANPTIENGQLMGIYGYEVIPSYFMHWNSLVNTSYEYLTEATGKIDIVTAADNTKGAILAVRWDHWRLGFRRRMTTEVERIPRADAWEITSLMRFGLAQRDTEASAISYNLTV